MLARSPLARFCAEAAAAAAGAPAGAGVLPAGSALLAAVALLPPTVAATLLRRAAAAAPMGALPAALAGLSSEAAAAAAATAAAGAEAHADKHKPHAASEAGAVTAAFLDALLSAAAGPPAVLMTAVPISVTVPVPAPAAAAAGAPAATATAAPAPLALPAEALAASPAALLSAGLVGAPGVPPTAPVLPAPRTLGATLVGPEWTALEGVAHTLTGPLARLLWHPVYAQQTHVRAATASVVAAEAAGADAVAAAAQAALDAMCADAAFADALAAAIAGTRVNATHAAAAAVGCGDGDGDGDGDVGDGDVGDVDARAAGAVFACESDHEDDDLPDPAATTAASTAATAATTTNVATGHGTGVTHVLAPLTAAPVPLALPPQWWAVTDAAAAPAAAAARLGLAPLAQPVAAAALSIGAPDARAEVHRVLLPWARRAVAVLGLAGAREAQPRHVVALAHVMRAAHAHAVAAAAAAAAPEAAARDAAQQACGAGGVAAAPGASLQVLSSLYHTWLSLHPVLPLHRLLASAPHPPLRHALLGSMPAVAGLLSPFFAPALVLAPTLTALVAEPAGSPGRRRALGAVGQLLLTLPPGTEHGRGVLLGVLADIVAATADAEVKPLGLGAAVDATTAAAAQTALSSTGVIAAAAVAASVGVDLNDGYVLPALSLAALTRTLLAPLPLFPGRVAAATAEPPAAPAAAGAAVFAGDCVTVPGALWRHRCYAHMWLGPRAGADADTAYPPAPAPAAAAAAAAAAEDTIETLPVSAFLGVTAIGSDGESEQEPEAAPSPVAPVPAADSAPDSPPSPASGADAGATPREYSPRALLRARARACVAAAAQSQRPVAAAGQWRERVIIARQLPLLAAAALGARTQLPGARMPVVAAAAAGDAAGAAAVTANGGFMGGIATVRAALDPLELVARLVVTLLSDPVRRVSVETAIHVPAVLEAVAEDSRQRARDANAAAAAAAAVATAAAAAGDSAAAAAAAAAADAAAAEATNLAPSGAWLVLAGALALMAGVPLVAPAAADETELDSPSSQSPGRISVDGLRERRSTVHDITPALSRSHSRSRAMSLSVAADSDAAALVAAAAAAVGATGGRERANSRSHSSAVSTSGASKDAATRGLVPLTVGPTTAVTLADLSVIAPGAPEVVVAEGPPSPQSLAAMMASPVLASAASAEPLELLPSPAAVAAALLPPSSRAPMPGTLTLLLSIAAAAPRWVGHDVYLALLFPQVVMLARAGTALAPAFAAPPPPAAVAQAFARALAPAAAKLTTSHGAMYPTHAAAAAAATAAAAAASVSPIAPAAAASVRLHAVQAAAAVLRLLADVLRPAPRASRRGVRARGDAVTSRDDESPTSSEYEADVDDDDFVGSDDDEDEDCGTGAGEDADVVAVCTCACRCACGISPRSPLSPQQQQKRSRGVAARARLSGGSADLGDSDSESDSEFTLRSAPAPASVAARLPVLPPAPVAASRPEVLALLSLLFSRAPRLPAPPLPSSLPADPYAAAATAAGPAAVAAASMASPTALPLGDEDDDAAATALATLESTMALRTGGAARLLGLRSPSCALAAAVAAAAVTARTAAASASASPTSAAAAGSAAPMPPPLVITATARPVDAAALALAAVSGYAWGWADDPMQPQHHHRVPAALLAGSAPTSGRARAVAAAVATGGLSSGQSVYSALVHLVRERSEDANVEVRRAAVATPLPRLTRRHLRRGGPLEPLIGTRALAALRKQVCLVWGSASSSAAAPGGTRLSRAQSLQRAAAGARIVQPCMSCSRGCALSVTTALRAAATAVTVGGAAAGSVARTYPSLMRARAARGALPMGGDVADALAAAAEKARRQQQQLDFQQQLLLQRAADNTGTTLEAAAAANAAASKLAARGDGAGAGGDDDNDTASANAAAAEAVVAAAEAAAAASVAAAPLAPLLGDGGCPVITQTPLSAFVLGDRPLGEALAAATEPRACRQVRWVVAQGRALEAFTRAHWLAVAPAVQWMVAESAQEARLDFEVTEEQVRYAPLAVDGADADADADTQASGAVRRSGSAPGASASARACASTDATADYSAVTDATDAEAVTDAEAEAETESEAEAEVEAENVETAEADATEAEVESHAHHEKDDGTTDN